MGATHLTPQNFEGEVLKSNVPVLVDFWAEWCGPCKMIAPIVDELSKELAGKLKVTKLNVDDAQELAAKYNIMSIPTLLLFKGGEPVEQIVGAMSKDQLLEKINPQLA
ncbi:MAG: thioredoxin [Candidatus Omnitrophica bacterium]|nr:thioredoxin [Candidatus Omnitrophota bacterium]